MGDMDDYVRNKSIGGSWYAAQQEQQTQMNRWFESNRRNMEGFGNRSGSSFGGGFGGGSPAAGCFALDVPVMTPDGWRAIGTIERGSLVMGVDPATGSMAPATVLRIQRPGSRALVGIRLAGSTRTVATTHSHSFLTRRGWRKASRITPRDEILHAQRFGNCEWRGVAAVEALGLRAEVCNLVVSGHNDFIAGGLVSHSFTYFRRTRGLLANVFEVDWGTSPGVERAG
ncbi:MAG: Hint domain-containing protein [Burkholderiaceae bacterium]